MNVLKSWQEALQDYLGVASLCARVTIAMTRYVIITPVRDEEKYLDATIGSVILQQTYAAEWVIVNDGSTDRTGEIIESYAAQFPWIRAVHRPNRGFRKAGGGVVEAFYDGYNALQCDDWEFIVKLDGDLTFSPMYFEECFAHFRNEPKLGIGGGEIYHDLDGKLTLEVESQVPRPRRHQDLSAGPAGKRSAD